MDKKQEIINDLLSVYELHKDEKYFKRNMYLNEGNFSLYTIKRNFGDWAGLLREANLSNKSFYRIGQLESGLEDILDDIIRVNNINNTISIKIYLEHGKFTIPFIYDTCISWKNALYLASLKTKKVIKIRTKNIENIGATKEDLISDFQRVFEENGKITRVLYSKSGKYSEFLVRKHFNTYTNAFLESKVKIEYSTESFYETIRNVYEEYGFITFKLLKRVTNIPTQTWIKYCGKIDEICKNIGISYIPICTSFENILNVISKELNETPIFEWSDNFLINPKTKKNLRVDAYYPSYKLAIEYDGEQHSKYKPLWHKTYEAFLYRQYLDKLKDHLLIKNNIKLIRFNYDFIFNEEKILSILKEVITK